MQGSICDMYKTTRVIVHRFADTIETIICLKSVISIVWLDVGCISLLQNL